MNATYTQGDGKWHGEYMAQVRNMTSSSLRYVIADCREAIEAMPENPKCEQYMDEIHYCAMELRIRNEAAKPHDDAVSALMALHAKICDNPTHPNISVAQDQFDIADSAYDLAKYAECMLACICGSTILGGK